MNIPKFPKHNGDGLTIYRQQAPEAVHGKKERTSKRIAAMPDRIARLQRDAQSPDDPAARWILAVYRAISRELPDEAVQRVRVSA